ncbi:MAG: hypothetical protein K0S53_1550 [Bacteroidetes bacterium]|jgi:hypothetical protein|nr:hypothetical protein [Bacteroidota bacterium]MDF2450875.1 hypothetical protein [Bacteroidota bacterium]
MKKIYLMALTAALAISVNAQTTIKLKNPKNGESKGSTAKGGSPSTPMQLTGGIVCNTQYVAGTTMDLAFTLELTNTDSEFGDMVTITFPAGITPNTSTNNTDPIGPDDGSASSDGPEALVGVSGQSITWGNDDNSWGGIVPGTTYDFTVNVTVASGLTGNQNATYAISGDGYGSNPGGVSTTTMVILPAGASIVNMNTNFVGVLTSPTTVAAASNCSMGTHTIVAQIKNLGNSAESNIPVNYSVNGVASTLAAFPGPLAAGDSAFVFFPVPYDFSTQGVYNIKAWTAQTGETSLANDTFADVIVNSLPFALTSATYTNGIQTAYDFLSITQSWTGLGIGFGTSTHAHLGGAASFWTINNTTMGAPNGTYETMNILPCMDVTLGDTYRISYWKKSATATGVAVNGQSGVFSGLAADIASMTDVLKAYTALNDTSATGPLGWTKDSVDYVATATETRYFAIGGKGTLSGANQQINVRLDDIRIAKIVSGVGIKNNVLAEVSMFPNPTTGILNVNATEANSSLEVFNVIGDKVYTNVLVKGSNTLDLSGLANGAYFVKLNSNGQVTTKKVVLSK